MATVQEVTARTNARIGNPGGSSGKSLQQLAKDTGGKIKGNRVEYKVKGTKGGRAYKATRYAYAGDDANFDAPVASDVYTEDYGKDNYRGPVKQEVITSESLTPTPEIKFPEPSAPSNLGTAAITMAGGLASGGATTGTTPPAGPTPADSLKELISSMKEAPNAEKIYQKTEREVGLEQKQAAVNNFQNQINAITTKAQADKLSLEGQGRGVTDVIIGGQQAKIDREAAIQALPISAQLAAAQGDLASARDHMDTLFKIRLQDAQAKVDYKNKVAELVYGFATEQQKIALDDKRTAEDRAFAIQRDNISYARDLAATALENGQASLAASLMRLDSSSASYAKDIANLAGGIQAKSSSSSDLIGIGTPEKQQLLGAGYSAGDINTLIQGINDYGFQAVYDGERADGASKEKLTALQKVYNAPIKRTVEEVRSAVTTKFAADSLKSTYTEAELHKFAKDAGYGGFNLDSKATEVEKFLNSDAAKNKYIELLVAQERAAGRIIE